MTEQGSATRASTDAPAPDVFVSYASHDAAVATALVGALEAQGVVCWIAPRDVRAGALYADAIIRAINGARLFVLVLSASAIESSHVGKEIERASSKRRPIIALRIDAAPLTPALEYFLSESQWVEAQSGNMQAAYASLIDAIRAPARLSGHPAQPPAAVAPKSRALLFLVGAGFAAVIAYLVVDRIWLSKPPAPPPSVPAPVPAPAPMAAKPAIPEKSIAVLPFTDMSEKKDQEYFSDGLSEELIDQLTKVTALHVPARASSFYFKGQHTPLADIASALGVAYLLEGSVRKAGHTVRVTAELIRADNGYNVWSETYDRDLKDIFKVQDEISGRVVAALKVALPSANTADAGRTSSTEAHNQFLLGREFWNTSSVDGYRRAADAFRKAIALDPHYASAYAYLAWAEGWLGDQAGDPAGLTHALADAERAIELAPDAAEGYAVRSGLRAVWLWDWDGATSDYNKAFALNPTQEFVEGSSLAETLGNSDEAIRLAKIYADNDPLDAGRWAELADSFVDAGRIPEARAALNKAYRISPEVGHAVMAEISLLEGHPEQALAEIPRLHGPEHRLMITAMAQYSLHHPQESQQALDELSKTYANSAAYQVAQAYAWRGEKDQAFAWLERAYVQRDGGLVHIKADPLLAALRADPRFKAILLRMKLPA